MRLVLANLTCGVCGEEMNATIPVAVLHRPIECCICGHESVLAVAGASALPVPVGSAVEQKWQISLVVEAFLPRNGGQWARC